MEVSGQLHAPEALLPGKEPPAIHWIGGMGGPQSRSGCGGEEKNSQPLPGLEPPIIWLVPPPIIWTRGRGRNTAFWTWWTPEVSPC
jgi:hypothetical protein